MRLKIKIEMYRLLKLFILLLLYFLTISCDRSTFFNTIEPIEDDTWVYDNSIDFSMSVVDTINLYDFYFSVEHSVDYAWRNAFFYIECIYPDKTTSVDTIECIFADYSGRYLGKGLGKYRNIEYLIKNDKKFSMQGEYLFRVKHGMRSDTVVGISNIGLRVTKNR